MQIQQIDKTMEQCALRFTATMSPLKARSSFYDASFDYFKGAWGVFVIILVVY